MNFLEFPIAYAKAKAMWKFVVLYLSPKVKVFVKRMTNFAGTVTAALLAVVSPNYGKSYKKKHHNTRNPLGWN